MNMTEYTDYSPMKWNSEFSVGVLELDKQHKELMNFFNAALANCSDEKTEERRYFDKAIDAFTDSLEKHFSKEEQFLTGKNYDLYDEHKLEHIKLLEKINFIKNEIENNRWEMNLFILAITLKDMLMYHFNSYDISANEYFREENNMQPNGMQINEGEYLEFG